MSIPDRASAAPGRPRFTTKQGQYLAFIHAYTMMMECPPAEADFQQHFGVTPPTVHQMIVTLAAAGFIRRTPHTARSIELLVDPAILPVLEPRSIRTSARRS